MNIVISLPIFSICWRQGDVGCGKTIVAFLACMEVVNSGFQVSYYYALILGYCCLVYSIYLRGCPCNPVSYIKLLMPTEATRKQIIVPVALWLFRQELHFRIFTFYIFFLGCFHGSDRGTCCPALWTPNFIAGEVRWRWKTKCCLANWFNFHKGVKDYSKCKLFSLVLSFLSSSICMY